MTSKTEPPPEAAGQSYVAPKTSMIKLLVAAFAIVSLGAIFFVIFQAEPPVGEPPVEVLVEDGPPAIQLRPSLVIPGPAQVPHSANKGENARPDEVIIFRVDIRGRGYVLIGLEGPSGKLTKIYGGDPADIPLTGSHLLKDHESGIYLAVNLGPHKGKEITFVAALSPSPWEPFPESVPAAPRRFPNTEETSAPPVADAPLAWDRFSIYVEKEIPRVLPKPVE